FGEVGLAPRLPTGTDVVLSVSQGRSCSNRAPDQDVARVGLTLTQALLEGAGSAVNLASVRQAELETLASLYELDGFTEALVAEAETAYWLYTVAAQRIRIIEESLAIARRQAEEVEQRIEIGVLPLTEAASSQAEISQREQELIDARARLETLRFRLLRLVNPSKSGRLDRAVIALTEASTEATPITDVSERVLLAMARRPDLNEARLRLDQARLETIVTKNGLLPRLDLFITLGKTGYADSFSDSFRELDGPTYDFAAGVAFRQPLWNRSARARDLAARTSRDQAALAIENLEQIVELDVRTAAAEAERARQQIDASAATRALREEALRAENERFRVGQSTSLLIAQAQRDLLDSQIAEVDARVAYRLALIQLYLAEGTLLERRGLVVGDGEGR
ncbi:MAG: TolC family protein, partial [Planctomycetota bacterium]|nr:TolC family protein [Planctomycetota bacterium]